MKPRIKDFIEHVFSELKEASPEGYTLNEEVEFEISVVNQANVDGKIDLKIASLGATDTNEAVQKIKFVYSNAEQAAKNIDAQAHATEKMIFSLINPFIKIAKDFEKKQQVGQGEGASELP